MIKFIVLIFILILSLILAYSYDTYIRINETPYERKIKIWRANNNF